MVASRIRDRKHAQKRRVELRFSTGCIPPPWQRFMVASATICHTIQVLAQKSSESREEENHESSP